MALLSLQNTLRRFNGFFRSIKLKKPTLKPIDSDSVSVPDIVANEEKIVRVVYSPKNLKATGDELRANFYKSDRSGTDEVSTIRLDYCSEQFCKDHGRKHQQPEYKRKYAGLAMLIANYIRTVGVHVGITTVDVISTKEVFEEHADIVLGYIRPQEGDEYPGEYNYILEQLRMNANLIIDNSPDNPEWTAGNF